MHGSSARLPATLLTLLALCVTTLAQDDAAAEAQRLAGLGRHDEALALWRTLLDDDADGAATRAAAESLSALGRAPEGADLLEAWIKRNAKSDGYFAARRALFDLHLEAEDDAAAQDVGKKLLADFPDARGCYEVARVFLAQDWKLPKLKTDEDVWRKWTYDRTSGEETPDLRLAFIEVFEKNYPKATSIKNGSVLYAKAWAHMMAGRHDEAVDLGEKFLRKHRGESTEDRVRITLAECFVQMQPPRWEDAEKQLRAVLAIDGSKQHARAQEMLAAAESRGVPQQYTEGLPTADGLGRVVLLTNHAPGSKEWKALAPWVEGRKAEVVRFSGVKVAAAAKDLARIGPEFVAVAAHPTDVDFNFQLDLLELARNLDDDPLPDFHFGYLVARDAGDLEKLVQRALAKQPKTGARAVNLGALDGGRLEGVDVAMHFGHGTPWNVVDALSAEEIAELHLTGAPVVISGACFNGVLGRSWHRSARQFSLLSPTLVDTDKLVSLAWVHAGVGGYIAALEGDRGEMAMAEWDALLETAPTLGEVVGTQYRTACTYLPDGFAGFTRYAVGKSKGMSLADVMLRGMVSRILIGDPTLRPLAEPARARSTSVAVDASAKAELTLTVKVDRPSGGRFINTLPRSGRMPFDWKIRERIELPEGYEKTLGEPGVAVTNGAKLIVLTRHHVRHEFWGGRRYVNVQVESTDGKLATPGTAIEIVFPVQ